MAQLTPYGSVGSKVSRRDFLKLMTLAGTVITFAPFIDWGNFLPNRRTLVSDKAKVELPDGSQANINTFPVNHSETVIYPKTDDAVLNQEAFRTWLLIRLPKEVGGETNDISSFRLYSQICVHLWCMWNYKPWGLNPQTGKMAGGDGQCPCHGSMYDVTTGKAYKGPASLQGPPANVLPRLDLQADAKGNLWILPPVWDLKENGIIGYGRYL